MATIVWFRQDLRVADNPALSAAVEAGEPVIPLYIHAPQEEGVWGPGGATKWWLHHSLEALAKDLQKLGSRLILRTGDSAQILTDIIKETNAKKILWNRRYEPVTIARDAKIKEGLKVNGLEVESFNGSLLCEPWDGCKADGTPYQVYTPFWKNLSAKGFGIPPLSAPRSMPAPQKWPNTISFDDLALLPKIGWAKQFSELWNPGSQGAHDKLATFLKRAITEYDQGRNIPAEFGTSRLSPHLHFGEISPNQIVAAVRAEFKDRALKGGIETYIKEIVWREFAYHLLYHFPETPEQPLRKDFLKFPWAEDKKLLRAWQQGATGYPIIDAGMRELWKVGWMHNRVRMIAGSFLVKDLLIPWQDGARWFWDTLVDADLASNTLGWQWTAGCGADAAPYFRVFNPILQGEKFDPEGEYVKRWVPELAALPAKWVHRPWEAPAEILKAAGVSLGDNYPRPIVDHGEARDAALEAYEQLKENRK